MLNSLTDENTVTTQCDSSFGLNVTLTQLRDVVVIIGSQVYVGNDSD